MTRFEHFEKGIREKLFLDEAQKLYPDMVRKGYYDTRPRYDTASLNREGLYVLKSRGTKDSEAVPLMQGFIFEKILKNRQKMAHIF